MFFPEKINIKKNYKVLEIGPGNTPFYKSNVLLEKKFTKEEFDKQTGLTGGDSFGKKIIYYNFIILKFFSKTYRKVHA